MPLLIRISHTMYNTFLGRNTKFLTQTISLFQARWGRCQEGYGEDPYLQAECVKQYVQGLQYGPDKKHIEAIATCKHFDVHTGPENIPVSRFSFDAIVSYRDWIETFQPAFKACGAAGAMSYMCSYNSINGVPACANRELLGDLLRGEWNFTGFVVSKIIIISHLQCTAHYKKGMQ
jgi:beta-glucosidase